MNLYNSLFDFLISIVTSLFLLFFGYLLIFKKHMYIKYSLSDDRFGIKKKFVEKKWFNLNLNIVGVFCLLVGIVILIYTVYSIAKML
jgi:hypothetical protein